MRVPHESALIDKAIDHFSAESKGKVESKRAFLMLYNEVKRIISAQMNVFPIAPIPHKSNVFWLILDLLFLLRLIPHGHVSSINEKSKKTAPGGAIDQIGHVLIILIRAFAEAPECANIFQEKWYIKDRFWRLYYNEGEEWNFFYVFPKNPGVTITLVVPMSLQMGWIELPH